MDITGGNGINDYYLYNGNFLIMANTTLETIKDILVLVVTPITLALIAYKQVRISIKQAVIHKQIDGMKSELVAAVAGKENAEGQLKGMEKARQDTIIDSTAKAVAAVIPEVQKVEVVEQAKPIVVEVKKDVKK